MTDVNKQAHYTAFPLEPIDVIEQWGLENDFYIANALKYIGRFRFKGTPVEDLKKCVWYLNRKIQKLEADEHTNKSQSGS